MPRVDPDVVYIAADVALDGAEVPDFDHDMTRVGADVDRVGPEVVHVRAEVPRVDPQCPTPRRPRCTLRARRGARRRRQGRSRVERPGPLVTIWTGSLGYRSPPSSTTDGGRSPPDPGSVRTQTGRSETATECCSTQAETRGSADRVVAVGCPSASRTWSGGSEVIARVRCGRSPRASGGSR